MDAKTNGALPAHPVHLECDQIFEGHKNFDGLTKRELFAAMAMQGMLAMTGGAEMVKAVNRTASRKGMDPDDYLAAESVSFADKLLAALTPESAP